MLVAVSGAGLGRTAGREGERRGNKVFVVALSPLVGSE